MQVRTLLPATSAIPFLLALLLLPFAIAVPASTQSHVTSPAQWLSQQYPPHQEYHQAPDRETTSSSWQPLTEYLWSWLRSTEPAGRHTLQLKAPELPTHLCAQYGDQMVLRFNLSTHEEAKSLAEAADILFLDIWESSGEWVDIRVAKPVLPSLLGLLPSSLQHAHVPLLTGRDLVRAIAEAYPPPSRIRAARTSSIRYNDFESASRQDQGPGTDAFFDEHRPLATISSWMSLQQAMFPSLAELISVGKSSEGRNILALRVGVQPLEPPTEPRKTIIVSGGSHAREWISTTTVNYVANALLISYGQKSAVTRLLQEFDFIFVPTLNPDGYQYTWESDRLWRKNRQSTSLRFCRGLDLDRTWGFQWDDRATDNPCSESYAGAGPFEADETKAFADWAKNESQSNNVEFVGLLDLHSYSEQIMYPYSFSCSENPPTLEDLEELGQGLAKAIRSHSHENYKVIPACEGNVAMSGGLMPRMEGGGGSLLDWFYHEMKVRRAFQIKLRDKGSYGFLLPRQYIHPTGLEMLRALMYFGKALSAAMYSDEELYSGMDVVVQRPLS